MAPDSPNSAARESAKDEPQETVERTTTTSTSFEQHGPLLSKRGQIPPSQPQESVSAAFATGAAALDVQLSEYANGYHFPPKYSMKDQLRISILAFWDFYNTGFGFFLTIYGLLIVGWGAMIFLLLVNAVPGMCWVNGHFDCNDINSPRRIWIENDSQILTALFSVTGFGLAPWRIRDLYYLLRYRMRGDQKALRTLAGVHRGWFRLEGSDHLPPNLGPKNIEETTMPYNVDSVPYPLETIPDPPLTGIRSPPSELWRLDFIVWLNIWHTILMGFLAGFMWALSRYDRPAWTTGLFVALTLIASTSAGIMEALQGRKVKTVEGVPLTKMDLKQLARDKELGIPHYNNIKDKDPEEESRKRAEKRVKKESGLFRRSEKLEPRNAV
ncbi:hypothetical protein F5Y19DRAFT_410283 [Xylariaceae sp. FL1651]|nr:hypothetical protein F5Y19DRAFT_410283 [Xylariaceae sp. FL1651]